MIKYIIYHYKFLLLLIKIFRVLHVGGSKKMGLLKNTYDTKLLPKAIVVFQIGLWNSLSYIYQVSLIYKYLKNITHHFQMLSLIGSSSHAAFQIQLK